MILINPFNYCDPILFEAKGVGWVGVGRFQSLKADSELSHYQSYDSGQEKYPERDTGPEGKALEPLEHYIIGNRYGDQKSHSH